MTKLTLLAVFAHPDDEAYGVGGTLARYAAEGVDVYLVTATRGEAGEIKTPELASPANLPQVREQELRCACQALGIHPPRFLDYVDGQLTIVNQGQAVAKVVYILRELRPQVVIAFGPDGIYGHYDHIAVHRWATAAVALAADPQCFPEQLTRTCQPHAVSKLYYHVLAAEQMASLSEDGQPAVVLMDGVPFPFVAHRAEEITTRIDVSNYLEAKVRAIACHVTQVGREDAPGRALAEAKADPLIHYEAFILAQPRVGWPEGVETDLFARVR